MDPRPLGPPGWSLVEHDEPAGARRLRFVPFDREHHDRELAALGWLAGHDLSPAPVTPPAPAETDRADSPGLWFEAPAGCPADWAEIRVQPGAVVEAMGRALAHLHRLPVTGDPSSPGLAVLGPAALVARAAKRIDHDLVDQANFEPARTTLAPHRLLEQLRALLPLLADRAQRKPVRPVPTHGAARPDAFWLHQGQLRSLLGVSGLALADPYRDLAATSRWLVRNVSGEALPAFFAAYGDPNPDPIRLEFYVLLDELR